MDVTVPTYTEDELRADPEKAIRQLRAVTDYAREAHQRAESLKETVDKVEADFRTAQQALAEAANRANRADPYTDSERGLRQWVSDEGEVVLTVDPERGSERVISGGKITTRRHEAGSGSVPFGLLDGEEIHGSWHRRLLELVQQRSIVRAHTGSSPRTDAQIQRHMSIAPGTLKRIFTDSTGVGGEWVPDNSLPLLWETVMLERRVEALFMGLNMTQKNVTIPFLATGLRPYKKGTPTTDSYGAYTQSSLATSNRTKVASGLAVRYSVDEDSSEDSIVDTMPIIERALVSAIVDGAEDVILNGDNQGAHGDTGIASWNIAGRWGSTGLGGTDDHRRLWMGLRHIALAITGGGTYTASADGSGAETAAGMAGWRKAMGPHGANAADLAYITSIEWLLGKIITFDEVETVEKYGPNASILSGEVGRIYGIPIIVSEFMSPDMNASGVYDASTLDYTGALCVKRSRFMMGSRRGITVERQKVITSGVWENVATRRAVFFGVDADDSGWASATCVPVYYAYKLTD